MDEPINVSCPTCGGPMIHNKNKRPNTKQPDYICADESCVTDSGYRSGAWKPSPQKGPKPNVISTSSRTVGEDKPDWEAKDRMTMRMSAWKSASDVYSGTSNEAAVRKLQEEIYQSILSSKELSF